MGDASDNDSDFNEQELDSLNQENVNKIVHETVVRRSIPVQRDLAGQVIPGQTSFYEEVKREITFGPTHHAFNSEALDDYIYPTNFEVRDYQFDIVRKALFQNTLCAIPTGMGKTFIASAVMLNYFRWTNNSKIIFTAPTRPLVAQQIKACLGITGIPSNQTAILLDKSRKNREVIWATKRIFFTTPQVVENDLKRGVLNPKDIVCLVIDEAHRATGSYAYTNVVKFISRFNTSYRILALTATPGADLACVQEVVNNLEISKIESRTEESMDIVRYMKRRNQEKIEVGLTSEIEDVIEKLGIAIMPVLQQAVELGIYDECEPSKINAFKAMQQSQKIIANPNIPEGLKWRNFFILQLLNHVGQMLKRVKIYGIKTFYNYFTDKYKEFTTKYTLGKSTNKLAAEFYYHPILKNLMKQCDKFIASPTFLGHGKLQHVRDELAEFFVERQSHSRVIIFTELRESALEIVKCVDGMNEPQIKPHIFIGQAKGKEGFDEVNFTRKNQPKGRKKADRLKRQEDIKKIEDEKKNKKKQDQLERNARRTGSSEEAQLNGMTQKQQKEVIQKFKNGDYNVLVCTSIGEEGLDIGEVDLIICYDTTSSPIKNIQRMGRTGRKRDGKIILLFSGNESYKFEQAMKDYSSLQKLISQNYLQYRKSDRILPAHIEPQCRKEFITISKEDQDVNEMEDSEEVIRYATQCMLGKTPKGKRKSKLPVKKEKQFFMPDNVNTEIITAGNLVNKYAIDENGNRIKQSKKGLSTLDKLEYDSLDLSSPSKSDFDDTDWLDVKRKENKMNFGTENPNFFKKLQLDKNIKMQPLSPEKTSSYIMENVSLGQKIDNDEHSTPVTKKKRLESKPTSPCVKHIQTIERPFKNVLGNNGGLLTSSEREFFLKRYSVLHTVSIDTIPNFHGYSNHVTVPHSSRNEKLLQLFKDLRDGTKSRIIEMNRTKCIARGLQSGIVNAEEKELSLIAKNDTVTYISRPQEGKKTAILDINLANADDLNDILDSGSDF